MRERIEDMAGLNVAKLAEATRGLARAFRELDNTLTAMADPIADTSPKEPATTVHWHGPFEWRGGECPVPPETAVRFEGNHSTRPASGWNWRIAGERFSYAADNPEGWLPRPESWVPPDEAWPLEWRVAAGVTDLTHLLPEFWEVPSRVTHIRLLPRSAAAEPAPIPTDTRAVVREALEFAIGNGRRDGFWTGPPAMSVHDRLNDLCRHALTALDASPPPASSWTAGRDAAVEALRKAAAECTADGSEHIGRAIEAMADMVAGLEVPEE